MLVGSSLYWLCHNLSSFQDDLVPEVACAQLSVSLVAIAGRLGLSVAEAVILTFGFYRSMLH